MRRLRYGLAAVLAFCVSVFGGMPASWAAFPGGNGLIAYESNQTGNFEIYVMNADGSAKTRLTTGGATDPAWSPDGTKIAFATGFSGNSEIYVMNADGSNIRQVTNRPGATDIEPSWSPNGNKLAFASFSMSTGNYDIWVVNADGTGETNITNNPAEDVLPVWQSRGSKIAFRSSRDGNAEIYLVNPDGTGVVNVTNNPGWDGAPDWSPDGTKIAFESVRGEDYSSDIYTMNADGTGVTRLTYTGTDGFSNKEAAWSPDGTKLAFVSSRDFNDEIYVMNADGSNPVRLTNNAPPGWTVPQDWFPDWQPLAVPDTTAPVITVPSAVWADATSPDGGVVNYVVTVTDDIDPDPVLVCAPASGTLFAIGMTTVTCTATDAQTNQSTATFSVHVKGAIEQLADLYVGVMAIGPGTSLGDKVTAAQQALADGDLSATCSILLAFNNQVKAQTGKTIEEDVAVVLIDDANRIRAVLGC